MNQQTKYDVDIVLCIDATGSMSPVIGETKKHALGFYESVIAKMNEKLKKPSQLRVRVIVFRDIFVDGEQWLNESPFFVLPTQTDEFNGAIRRIEVDGGGDAPESGLEALAIAMKSDWCKSNGKKRHIIVVCSDDSAHPIERSRGSQFLPENLPENFDQLTDFWMQNMDKQAKRLLLFTPDAYPWTEIATHWENTIHLPSKGGSGLQEHDFETMLEVIAASA
jgi:hypothetical protein